MTITKEWLTRLLTEAYDCGQQGCYDLRQQCIDDILGRLDQEFDCEWITLTLKQLRELPVGRRLFHSLFGYGVVSMRISNKYVQFAGFRMDLVEDGWPWNHQIKLSS